MRLNQNMMDQSEKNYSHVIANRTGNNSKNYKFIKQTQMLTEISPKIDRKYVLT